MFILNASTNWRKEIEKMKNQVLEIWKLIIRIGIICCATILTAIISLWGVPTKITLVGIVLSSIIITIMEIKLNILSKIFDEFKITLSVISVSLTVLIIEYNKNSIIWRWTTEINEKLDRYIFLKKVNMDSNRIIEIAICLSSVFIFIILYSIIKYSLKYIKNFIQELDKIDKIYLIGWTSVVTIVVIVLYSKTTAFYLPTYELEGVEQLAPWDVIYSLDTPSIIANNYLWNIYSGDLGHSLFSLIMVPIRVIIVEVAKLYHVIPNIENIILTIFNAFILNICAILMKRILSTNWMLVFMTLAHPVLIFSLTSERYQLTTLFIILSVYFCLKENGRAKEIVMAISAGTTITNIALIPFVGDFKDKKGWFISMLRTGLLFGGILVITGRINILITSITQFLGKMSVHASPTSFAEKLIQYPTFIVSCIFATPYTINNWNYPSFFWKAQEPVNMLGILILLFIGIAFYKNKEKKYAQICIYWVIFSFFLLPVAGWGVGEFQLFAIFFAWAVISLIYMGIDKLCLENHKTKSIILGCIAINVGIVNLIAIKDIVDFAIQYYPIIR